MTAPAIAGSDFETITEYLMWDHQRLDDILRDVARMAEDSEFERAEHTFREFDDGLRRHIRLEEDLLFPLFERQTGAVAGPTVAMRHEHQEILAATEGIVVALDQQNVAAFRAAHGTLCGVLEPHNWKEEHILYPSTDSALPAQERVAFTARLRSG